MTCQARIARLEAKHGGADAGPTVIYICDAITREPGGALMMGGSGLAREQGETVESFMARPRG